NIVSGFATGINIAPGPINQTTRLLGNLYKDNATNWVLSGASQSFQIVLGATDPLFVNAAAGNFYLAAQSPAIDSSVDAVDDRNDILAVKTPMGIAPSPALAPVTDVVGQLRRDDPTFPN